MFIKMEKVISNFMCPARSHIDVVYHASLWLKQTLLRFPLTHHCVESLSHVCVLLGVRGSIDHFPSSAQ